MPRLENCVGKKFGKLLVIAREKNRGKQTSWKCICECGRETILSTYHVKRQQSCGCHNRRWKKSEEEYLLKNYSRNNLRNIAEHLGKNYKLVSNKAARLGLTNKRVYSINEDFFDNWSSEMAYSLGLITADGCVQKKVLIIGFQSLDKEMLYYLKSAMNSDHPIHDLTTFDKRTQKEYFNSFLEIGSKRILAQLKNYGVIKNKTGKEVLPNIPSEFKADYLRGLFDGDGHFTFYKRKSGYEKRVGISSSNEKFLHQIRESLFFGFGRITKKHKNCHQLITSKGSEIKQIGDFIYYNNFCFGLQRKYFKFLQFNRIFN